MNTYPVPSGRTLVVEFITMGLSCLSLGVGATTSRQPLVVCSSQCYSDNPQARVPTKSPLLEMTPVWFACLARSAPLIG